MPLRSFKPVTPSNRYKVWPTYEEITKKKPEKGLTEPLPKSGGRNNQGRITCRHIGGGHKRKYRLIDFKRRKREVRRTGPSKRDAIKSRESSLLGARDGRVYLGAQRIAQHLEQSGGSTNALIVEHLECG